MARTALNLIDPALRHCIDECLRCHEVCLSTIPYCLEQGGRHATEAHVTSLYDCAAICGTSADFMLRGSDEHARLCAVCAALCHRCADACDMFADDEVMRACAEACRACAATCERMTAVGV